MNPLRLGFVGVGRMGQAVHLRNYLHLPDCQVAAIADLRLDVARQVAARYGVPKVFASHAEMLAAERPDAVVVALPAEVHGQVLPDLLRAGVPLLVQPPLAAGVAEAEALVAEITARQAWVMLAYHRRSDPATIHARAEISRCRQTGELGALRYVRVQVPGGDWVAAAFHEVVGEEEGLDLPPPAPPAAAPDTNGQRLYREFVDRYLGPLNLLRHLLGEPYEVAHADPSGVLLAVQSHGGVPAVVELGPCGVARPQQEEVLACFERGYVRLVLPAPLSGQRPGEVELMRQDGDGAPPGHRHPHLPWVDCLAQQAATFVSAVRRQAPPLCSAAEALADLRLARDYLARLRGG